MKTQWGTVKEVADKVKIILESGQELMLNECENCVEGDLVAITEYDGEIMAQRSCGFARGMWEQWQGNLFIN